MALQVKGMKARARADGVCFNTAVSSKRDCNEITHGNRRSLLGRDWCWDAEFLISCWLVLENPRPDFIHLSSCYIVVES